MLLVGSNALLYHAQDGRIPKDTDYICTHDEAKQFIIEQHPDKVYPNPTGTTLICWWDNPTHSPIELMIAWPGSSTELIYNTAYDRDFIPGVDAIQIADLDTLYLLKMSHRYLKNSPHFLKTMRDIQLMRKLGAKIAYPAILSQRESETYNYAHPSLSRDKRGFFDPNEGVGYKYDHDTIHVAMAIEPLKPAYSHYQKDGAEVSVDKNKWNACSPEVKIASVYEEACVLALERSQIPYRGRLSPERSFKMALMKVCTSISSGWWREYAWEHYDQVIDLFNRREAEKSYLTRFDDGVRAGIVRELQTEYHG